MIKYPVKLSVLSHQQDGDLSEMSTQTHDGFLHLRDNGDFYLLWDENKQQHTTLRLEGQSLRLYRRGEINNWQVFEKAKETMGVLNLGGNDLQLRIETTKLDIKKNADASGQIQFSYGLWGYSQPKTEDDLIEETPFGHFAVTIAWEVLA
jgi:uncharacterized beta-barrel protein YwiB (DUF1934 family)